MDVYTNQSRLTDIVVTKGDREGEMNKLGVQDLEIQTTTQKIGKQQRYTMQHRELQPLFYSNFNEV